MISSPSRNYIVRLRNLFAETGLSANLEKKRTPTKPKVITIVADKKVTREGRVLLKLLEHGDGPAIEIAWPAARSAKTNSSTT